jgi:hypothetical protein
VNRKIQIKEAKTMKTYFKLMTIATVLSGFVLTANAQSIGTGPEADPYWRQFVPHQNVVQLAPVASGIPSGIESDAYWSQFLPKENASVRIDSGEVKVVGGPESDPYWSQFLPNDGAILAAHTYTASDIALVTK